MNTRIRLAVLHKMRDNLALVRKSSIVQRSISNVVLDVDKNVRDLGKNLHKFILSKSAAYMQRSISLLASRINFSHLLDQKI